MKFYCIYCISNLINGKTYIGQHKTENLCDKYMGSGKILHVAYKKYGLSNFTKTILAVAGTKKIIDILEKFYIQFYRRQGKAEYNVASGGTSGQDGRKHTAIEKIKIAQASSEHWKREGYKEKVGEKISESLTGKKRNELVWNKGKSTGMHWWNNGVENIFSKECPEGFVAGRILSEFQLEIARTCNVGRTHVVSEKTKKKISETQKKNPNKSMLGRKHTEETRRKMSESAKNRIVSKETRRKLSEYMKGRKMRIVNGKRTWILGD